MIIQTCLGTRSIHKLYQHVIRMYHAPGLQLIQQLQLLDKTRRKDIESNTRQPPIQNSKPGSIYGTSLALLQCLYHFPSIKVHNYDI